MKTLTVIAIGLVSLFCISTNNDDVKYQELDFSKHDALVASVVSELKTHDKIYEKGQDYLLDTIHHLGTGHRSRTNELAARPHIVVEDKKVRSNIVHIPVCKYKTVVYTIFTPRGAHVRGDTLDASTYEILTHRNNN